MPKNRRVALSHVELHIACIRRKPGQIAQRKGTKRRRKSFASGLSKSNAAAEQHHYDNGYGNRPHIRRRQAADVSFQFGQFHNQRFRAARRPSKRSSYKPTDSRHKRTCNRAYDSTHHDHGHQASRRCVHRQSQQRNITVKEQLYRHGSDLRAQAECQRFSRARMTSHPCHTPGAPCGNRSARQQNPQ